MAQTITLSEAQSDLEKLVKKIRKTKKSVIILQDNTPSVVMYPYEKVYKKEKMSKKEFQKMYKSLKKEGKELGDRLLAEKGLNREDVTEEEFYDLFLNDHKHA